MFSVVNAVLLQLPFSEPERLVAVQRETPRGPTARISPSQLTAWSAPSDAIDAIAGYSMWSPVLTGVGDVARLRIECVSAGMFDVLGVPPAIGRAFEAREDAAAAALVVVVSHAFWTTRLHGVPEPSGRVLTMNGAPVTILGVMPKAFDGPRALDRIDGWMPLQGCIERGRVEGDRRMASINVYARLKPGVDVTVAAAQLDAAAEPSPNGERSRVQLTPLTEGIVGETREPLLALFGAAGLVLLIACANVASLLLGRADARRRELAVRMALGCSRARLVRQLLTESVLFALTGGAAGILMAKWSLGTMLALMPGGIRRLDHVAIDGNVLAVALALSIATGLLFGWLPAFAAARVPPAASLKDSALAAGRSRRVLRAGLVGAEIALSVALLAGAGLLIKTFLHLRPTDPGFDPSGKVASTISLPRQEYPDETSWRRFAEMLAARLSDKPEIRSLAIASYLPLSGFVSTSDVRHAGTPASSSITIYSPHVSADYFRTMRIPIVRGRGFDGTTASDDVAVVNETLARRMWPDRDALGQTLAVQGPFAASTMTVIGVVRDVRDAGHRLGARPELYVSATNRPVPVQRIVIETSATPQQIASLLRADVAAIDARLPIGDVEPVETIIGRSVATWRFAATLLGLFAAMAATLTAVGLFAIVASWVTERTAEIGVRMALGAGRARVLRLFLARAAVVSAAGVASGLGLAALTTKFLGSWLVDASPLDRQALAIATLVMAAVCLAATYVAARRATNVDPIAALRG